MHGGLALSTGVVATDHPEAGICAEAASPWSCAWRGEADADADEGRVRPGEVARIGPEHHTIQFILGAIGDVERWDRLAASDLLQHADSQLSSVEMGSAPLTPPWAAAGLRVERAMPLMLTRAAAC